MRQSVRSNVAPIAWCSVAFTRHREIHVRATDDLSSTVEHSRERAPRSWHASDARAHGFDASAVSFVIVESI